LNATGSTLTIRRMHEGDLPFLNEMVHIAGWNQIEADWRRYMRLQPDGCFVAEADGLPAGTLTTITYEDKIGWIGMLIVSPEYRGRGIGTTLLKHGIEYLRPQVQVIKLDATPQGQPLYEKLGFEAEYTIVRMSGKAAFSKESRHFYPMTDFFDAIIPFDAQAFGANRSRVLENLVREYSDYSFCALTDRVVTGYIMANRGRKAWHIAPWVCKNEHVAKGLLEEMLKRLSGENIYIDVPLTNAKAISLLESIGFTEQRRLERMYLGENKWPGEPKFIFAVARPEKG